MAGGDAGAGASGWGFVGATDCGIDGYFYGATATPGGTTGAAYGGAMGHNFSSARVWGNAPGDCGGDGVEVRYGEELSQVGAKVFEG